MKKTNLKWTVFGLMTSLLLSSLDQTVVSTAMPTVIAQLGGLASYSWVFTVYLLTSVAVVPIFGKLSDLYGRKRFYLLGLFLFMLGSALCGTSTNMTELILYRGLQGIGAGALMPITFAIIFDVFPPEKRGSMQGFFGAVFGLSSILGPTIGAFFTEHVNWRWIFYINLPLGILSVIVLSLSLVETRAQGIGKKVDYAGAITMVISVVSLLFALVLGGKDYAWDSWQIFSLFATFAAFLVIFLLIEKKAEEPMLPLDMFNNRTITMTTVITFLSGIALLGGSSYIPLFVQGVIGGSATNAGNILTPMMLAVVVGSTAGGFLMNKIQFRPIMAVSMLFITAGSFFLSRITPSTTLWEIVMYMILMGLGLGPLFPATSMAVLGAVSQKHRGVATSTIAFFRMIGGTIGIAVMGALVSHYMNTTNPQQLLQPEARQMIPAPVLKILQQTLSDAIDHVFLVSLVAGVIGVVAGVFYGNARLAKAGKPQEESGSTAII